MTGWLLDTNVLSELRRPRPHAKVLQFVSVQSLDLLHVSVVTFAEIRFGIALLQDAGRRMELNDWLTNTLRPATQRFTFGAREIRTKNRKWARAVQHAKEDFTAALGTVEDLADGSSPTSATAPALRVAQIPFVRVDRPP